MTGIPVEPITCPAGKAERAIATAAGISRTLPEGSSPRSRRPAATPRSTAGKTSSHKRITERRGAASQAAPLQNLIVA